MWAKQAPLVFRIQLIVQKLCDSHCLVEYQNKISVILYMGTKVADEVKWYKKERHPFFTPATRFKLSIWERRSGCVPWYKWQCSQWLVKMKWSLRTELLDNGYAPTPPKNFWHKPSKSSRCSIKEISRVKQMFFTLKTDKKRMNTRI